MEHEPEIINSPLTRIVELDGQKVRVEIYTTDRTEWILEAVDEEGTSYVWGEPFETDEAAFEEFSRTVRDDGMEALYRFEPASFNDD